jgi:hypothetical protein
MTDLFPRSRQTSLFQDFLTVALYLSRRNGRVSFFAVFATLALLSRI